VNTFPLHLTLASAPLPLLHPPRHTCLLQDKARAKRYQDEHEMAQRAKEAASRERREAMQRELEASRVAQLAWKEAQREEAGRVERQEFERIMAVKRQKEEQEHTEVGPF
jgi:hypothetical protein